MDVWGRAFQAAETEKANVLRQKYVCDSDEKTRSYCGWSRENNTVRR